MPEALSEEKKATPVQGKQEEVKIDVSLVLLIITISTYKHLKLMRYYCI